MRLKLLSMAFLNKVSSRPWGTLASVAIKASMVAMSGRIIPAPFDIPVSVTVLPSTSICRETSFGRVSVVRMAFAARGQPSVARALIASGNAALIVSAGRSSPITPVENGMTRLASTSIGPIRPAISASASQVARAAAMPGSPVPAFALPVLMSQKRAVRAFANQWARAMCTGAAQNAFWVYTAATVAPSAISITVRSSLLGFLIPACATPKRMPATGKAIDLSTNNRPWAVHGLIFYRAFVLMF